MANLQDPTVQLIIYVGIFVGILLAFEGLRQMLSRNESNDAARSRRLKMISSGLTAEERLAVLKPRVNPWALRGVPGLGELPTQLRQAGFLIKPGLFMLLCAALGLLIMAVAAAFVGLSMAVAVFPIGFALPLLVLQSARAKRIDAMVMQLPDALELMARGLKVGHPLNTTLASVAEEMADPIGTEFGILVDQVSYGDDLPDATNDLANRVDQEDIRYLAAAIAIQHGTGSDLGEILNTLARVIRDRLSMRRKVKAITAEGRLTAVFLSMIPIFLFSAVMIMTPSYYGGVMGDPLFRPGAIIVISLTIGNYLAMRRLVNFRY